MEILNQKIKDYKYLNEFLIETPSHFLINKGITGCGGTTLELKSKRNSIILCPTINLVKSKSSLGYFGVYGDVSKEQIKNYIFSESSYKKIIATYDSLKKLMESISNYSEYFLLIDEYHLLFNDYSLRTDAIMFLLQNFKKFKNWAFLTATPLKQEFILKELKDVNQINYIWEKAVPVKMNIRDTYYVQKELVDVIEMYKDRNLHIFLNSVNTIKSIIDRLYIDDYRVICSKNSKSKITKYAEITDPVKKLNFYTSCSFEGTDIYDPNGYCIILCDTNISSTVLDIATKVRQICGRLRDSIYKDECCLILNTNKHRYAGTSRKEFESIVADSEKRGKKKSLEYESKDEDDMITECKLYSKETYSSLYLSKYNNKIFYDENLKKLDIYNYNLISEIYNNSISVLTECSKNNINPVVIKTDKGLEWIKQELIKLDKYTFTYEELKNIFEPLFIEHGLKWNIKNSIKNYFPDFKKRVKKKNGIKHIYYYFK